MPSIVSVSDWSDASSTGPYTLLTALNIGADYNPQPGGSWPPAAREVFGVIKTGTVVQVVQVLAVELDDGSGVELLLAVPSEGQPLSGWICGLQGNHVYVQPGLPAAQPPAAKPNLPPVGGAAAPPPSAGLSAKDVGLLLLLLAAVGTVAMQRRKSAR